MKGVILAGGTGSRLLPLTKMMNKHLLPVGRYPMIYHSITKLKNAGIEQILLILAKQSVGLFAEFLGNGKEWGVQLTYKVQEEAGGIAQALALAEDYIPRGEKFIVLLGDNMFEDSLAADVDDYMRQTDGAKVLLKEVEDPRRYGVPKLVDGKIEFIDEKPSVPQSNYCVTGIYMYDSSVFDIIHSLVPSDRGELEITGVNNVYAAINKLSYGILKGWWTDAGTFHSLYEANTLMKDKEWL